MPDQDNDRLEQFFRKAASKADVTFNEEDWKKLEARLDAVEAGIVKTKKTRSNISAAAVVVGIVLLFSGGIWLNANYDIYPFTKRDASTGQLTQKNDAAISPLAEGQKDPAKDGRKPEVRNESESQEAPSPLTGKSFGEGKSPSVEKSGDRSGIDGTLKPNEDGTAVRGEAKINAITLSKEPDAEITDASIRAPRQMMMVDNKKVYQDLIQISPAIAERNKQKAVVKLPGAEGVDTREADAMVKEEHASDFKEHVATPRLSLLLSFAPDFSSTSLDLYSAPGNAYGAMIHYHIKNRWSVSTGVIKNFKQYTGSGEDYNPPKGYWKYYTNGIVPESIDGSCNILEFPVMVQYTISNTGKSKWLAGAGVSSYLMLNESYRYNFQTPNPGAREGWDSRSRSRFFLNMVNFTIGYEHQVVPGLMIGIEPYLKVPLQEIGWSNLKLYSTGASVSMRYTIVRRKYSSTPTRSRGPD